jgi:iron(III) transport system permease protein
VPTFTTGIYQAWFSMGERVVAAQLSATLLGFVILVLLLERLSRGRKRFHETSQRTRAPSRVRLAGVSAAAATALCAVPFILGFLLPAGLLLRMAVGEGDAQLGPRFLQLAANSVTLAALTAALLVVLALLMAYHARLHPGMFSVNLNRVAGLGYAVPGMVIAVGTLIPLAWLDNALDAWMRASFDLDRSAADGRHRRARRGPWSVLLDRGANVTPRSRRCGPAWRMRRAASAAARSKRSRASTCRSWRAVSSRLRCSSSWKS